MPVLLGAEETRETFAGLETWQIVLWYVLIAISVAIFLFGVGRLVLKYRRGRTKAPVGNPLQRAVATTKIVATHAWIRRRDPLSGLGHLLVFYGFVVLFIGTGILAFQDDFAEPVLGWFFWQGWFYLGYSLFLDVFGFALIVGLSVFAVKRGVLRPFRLSYWRPAEPAAPLADEAKRYRLGDWLFLGSLLFLALTGFLLESFRIAADDPSFEKWAPFGWLVGQAFIAMGFDGDAAESARAVTWWVHGVFALFWVSSIPFTKAVHMLAGPGGRRSEGRARRQRAPAAPGEREAGGGRLRDHRRARAQAPARPGRLHEVRQVPRRLPGDRVRLPALAARPRPRPARGGRGLDGQPGGARHPAALPRARRHPRHRSSPRRSGRACSAWPASRSARSASSTCRSSTRCAARSSSGARWTAQLQQTLETIYTSGNSFGEAKRKRGRWAKDLDFDVKDARKEPRRDPLVRRRLRLLRPAQPEDQPGARARPAPGRGRLRDPLRRRAHRRERRAPRRRGRPLVLAGRGERRDDLGLPLRPDPHLRPAHLQHAQERVSAARRRLDASSTTPSSCSSCSRRGGCDRARGSATGSPTTTRARSAATTASTTSRGR